MMGQSKETNFHICGDLFNLRVLREAFDSVSRRINNLTLLYTLDELAGDNVETKQHVSLIGYPDTRYLW